ncbi:GNAT family N-acetyltransferase [Sediminicola luteus]|uniref:N-acetyltransferase domain-containing protein n=1 Tax=Sediminicola luteus TaxID=319238 RepID=A0A2A4GDT6_9FLAO|nr:GNAT family N-acetyltransferase [Sediminicola luteus]PCE66613.1 hypothetical protein B7P33_04780 [Sediminicola luteus]
MYLLSGQETERIRFMGCDAKTQYHDWLPFFQDPATSRYWEPPISHPEKSCSEWFKKQAWRVSHKQGGMNALYEKTTDRLLGYAGLLVQEIDGNTELEVAYSLLPSSWGQGFATEAAQACMQWAKQQAQVPYVVSIISLTNLPSQKVAERNGMRAWKKTIYKNNPVYIYKSQPTNA